MHIHTHVLTMNSTNGPKCTREIMFIIVICIVLFIVYFLIANNMLFQ